MTGDWTREWQKDVRAYRSAKPTKLRCELAGGTRGPLPPLQPPVAKREQP